MTVANFRLSACVITLRFVYHIHKHNRGVFRERILLGQNSGDLRSAPSSFYTPEYRVVWAYTNWTTDDLE